MDHFFNSLLDLKIEAAAALCKVGSRALGLKTINAIVRNRKLAPAIRAEAAQELDRLHEYEFATKANVFLLEDGDLPIGQRCQAAQRLEGDNPELVELAWQELFPFLASLTNSVADRIVAAEYLLQSDDEYAWDHDHWDVVDQVLALLEQDGLSTTDKKLAIKILADAKIKFDTLPEAAIRIFDGDQLDPETSLEILKTFSAKDTAAVAKLHSVAERGTAPLLHCIGAFRHLLSTNLADSARRNLTELSQNQSVPAKWRFEAAKVLAGHDRTTETGSLSSLIADEQISVDVRLQALKEVEEGLSDAEAQSFLHKMASLENLGVGEAIAIATTATKGRLCDVAQDLLARAAIADGLTIAETLELVQALHSMKQVTLALKLVLSVAELPNIVLAALEDLTPIVEAARFLVAQQRPTEAMALLIRTLEWSDFDSAQTALDVIEEFANDGDIRSSVERVAMRLRDHADAENLYLNDWIRSVERHIQRGWTDGFGLLFDVARDEKRSLIDRVQAASALGRNESCDASGRWGGISQDLLLKLAQSDNEDVFGRLLLVEALHDQGHRSAVIALLDGLEGKEGLTVNDKRSLSKTLWRLEEYRRARAVLDSMSIEEQASGYWHPWEREWTETIQGKDRQQAVRTAYTYSSNDVLFNRLGEACSLALETGERRAIDLIKETALDESADLDDRIQALRMLIALGFRAQSYCVLQSIVEASTVDDLWCTELLVDLGLKSQAMSRLEAAATRCTEDQRDLVFSQLANLKMIDVLQRLNERFAR